MYAHKFYTQYYPAVPTAGYSGFVLYGQFRVGGSPSDSYWMVPGTFFDDWDNR